MRALAALFLVCALAGCSEKKGNPDFPKPDNLPAVQIHLSTDTPKVGEQMDLTLRVTADKRLVLPPVKEWLDPSLEVIDSDTNEIEKKTSWIQEQHLKLAIFQVTNLTLFAKSKISTLSDPPQELDLPFQSIQVASVLTGENPSAAFGDDSLPDFRGPNVFKRQKRNMIISAVAALVLLTGILLTLWLISRRPTPPPPVVPPHRIAFDEMKALTASKIWQLPDVDACAVVLSLILRRYIEARFEIRAPEQTTEEFLEMAELRAPWPEKDQAGLKQFFQVTDQIKFAASRPGNQVLEDLLTAARAFVESTRESGGTP